MIIAISQRNIRIDKGAGRDALENDYVAYFEKFDITLLPIPNVCKSLDKYFDDITIKGIILSGGNDVNPVLYGGKPKNEDFSEQRDNTEKNLLEIAIIRYLQRHRIYQCIFWRQPYSEYKRKNRQQPCCCDSYC